jgi:TPR repeat protein
LDEHEERNFGFVSPHRKGTVGPLVKIPQERLVALAMLVLGCAGRPAPTEPIASSLQSKTDPGRCAEYERGLASERTGSAKGKQTAMKSFEEACKLRCADACERAGYFVEFGKVGAPNPVAASRFYRQGCDLGAPHSCAELGWLYENGQGLTKDVNQAAEYYERACNGGDGAGCNDLGSLYRQGVGRVKDTSQALHLYEKACTLGDAIGCGNVGALYDTGTGVPQDIPRAKEFYKLACDREYEPACERLEK